VIDDLYIPYSAIAFMIGRYYADYTTLDRYIPIVTVCSISIS
jgi:hypothetical protein